MSSVTEDIKTVLKKLRREQKAPPIETIPKDHIKCTRCGRVVPQGKATVDLEVSTRTKEVWVCDDCFFGQAR